MWEPRRFINLQASTSCYRDETHNFRKIITLVVLMDSAMLGLFHPLEGCVGPSICLVSLLLRNPAVNPHPGGPSLVKKSLNNFDGSLQAYILAAPPPPEKIRVVPNNRHVKTGYREL
jgi:hypothetical protein